MMWNSFVFTFLNIDQVGVEEILWNILTNLIQKMGIKPCAPPVSPYYPWPIPQNEAEWQDFLGESLGDEVSPPEPPEIEEPLLYKYH